MTSRMWWSILRFYFGIWLFGDPRPRKKRHVTN